MVLRMLGMKMSVIFIAGIIWSVTTFSQSAVKTAISSKDIPATSTSNTPTISSSRIEPLQIGDEVPDIEFTMLNYPKSKARLSDFRGKLVILDFWATWCTVCTNSFSKMDSLQRLFPDQIKVILVNPKATGDEEANARRTYERYKAKFGNELSLPSALGDTVAYKFFPFRFFPNYVWILPDGKYIGKTGTKEVSASNIESILRGRDLSLKQKDDVLEIDRNKPLFINNNGGSASHLVYHSLISGYSAGLARGSNLKIGEDGKSIGISFVNAMLIDLYRSAYSFYEPNSQIIIYSKNFPFFGDQSMDLDDSILLANSYCYDLVVPRSSEGRILAYMQEDLRRSFGYEVVVEKRKMRCLVLSEFDNKGGQQSQKLDFEFKKVLKATKYVNCNITWLLSLLNQVSSDPVVKGTGISDDKVFNIEGLDFSSSKNVVKFLNRYNLSLLKVERELDVMVIRDSK